MLVLLLEKIYKTETVYRHMLLRGFQAALGYLYFLVCYYV